MESAFFFFSPLGELIPSTCPLPGIFFFGFDYYPQNNYNSLM